MRLGIVGPANGDLPALARAVQHLLDVGGAERVIYVGADDALDRVVASWAQDLVGGSPLDSALFDRAAARCSRATAEEVDRFVAAERARLRLKMLSSLPGEQRTIEILDGRVILFVYDKATLDEEDIAAASILVFGKSNEGLVRKVGTRTFVAPGPTGSSTGGAILLDDGAGGIRIEVMTAAGEVVLRESVGMPPAAAKVRVQRGGGA